MRKLAIVTTLGLLLLLGCQHDANTGDTIVGNATTTIKVSTASSRTSLGQKQGSTYPVYWSEGDKIAANGVESQAAVVNAEDASLAQFSFDVKLQYPYYITYPYTSTSSAEAPKVVFPAEQSYVEGSFCKGSAPMCGYVSQASDKIGLKHLAGVLRFAIKASEAGVVLEKVVVTSKSAEIAGEFSVDCINGTIAPCENAGNSITYTLPSNFTLSTDKESLFYIAVPAVDVGNCEVEFIASTGAKMVANWSGDRVKAGIVREFKTLSYAPDTSYVLTDFQTEHDCFVEDGAKGYVRDTNGQPLSGVAVSDGLRCTQTNELGYYSLQTNFSSTRHIFVSIPSGYKAKSNAEGMPLFYHQLTDDERAKRVCNADFVFEPIAGDANRFTLFVGADPQPRAHSSSYDRFAFRSLDICENFYLDLKESREKISGREVYGLMLGDIVHENMSLYPKYTAGIRTTGIQMFNVIGNHDHDYDASTDRDGARVFENYFGPSYYSVNLGKIHLVVLDNLIMKESNGKLSSSGYSYGLTEAQWTWLQNDMKYVDENTTIMVASHAPMFMNKSLGEQSSKSSVKHGSDYAALFAKYKKVHAWAGHTHVTFNYNYAETSPLKNLEVHIVARSTGELWTNEYSSSGTPRGYTIVEVDGDDVSWKFKPTIYQAEYIANQYSYTTGAPTYTYRDWDFVDGVAKMKDSGKTLDADYQMHGFAPGLYEDGYVYLHVYLWDDKWEVPKYNGVTMEHLKYNSTLSYNKAWKEFRKFYSNYCTTLSKNEDYVATADDNKTNNEHTMFRAPESNASGSGTFTVTDRFGNNYSRTITW